MRANEDVVRVHLFVLALVGFVVGLQKGLVALRLAPDVRVGKLGEDAGGRVHELALEGFGFGQLAALAFAGEQKDADHLVDELVASRAIGVYALIIGISFQNLVHLAGSEFDDLPPGSPPGPAEGWAER